MVRAVLELMHRLEAKLNSPNANLNLDVALLPVGSVVEGTKVGATDEADFMVFFRELHRYLWLKEDTVDVMGDGTAYFDHSRFG